MTISLDKIGFQKVDYIITKGRIIIENIYGERVNSLS